MGNEIHIGEIIRSQLKKQRRSASWLAEQMSCDRTNIYKIFNKKSIDSDMLFRISLILGENLFAPYIAGLSNMES